MRNTYLLFISIFIFAACTSSDQTSEAGIQPQKAKDSTLTLTVADAATILSKKEVPVLCYHHIRNFASGGRLKEYEVTPSAFAEQMKVLNDSGYKTILPDDLYEYLVHGKTLPEKAFMITFDDTDEEQFSIGAAEMKKYGYKGVFFIMSISINRPRYMNEQQLKELSDSGHVIAGHTWDHHMVTRYSAATWDSQLVAPQKRLESITGKPVKYFAYPFGIWSKEAFPFLSANGYKLAFILSSKRDSTEPLYTIRRMIVPGQWSARGMLRAMQTTFRQK